MKPNSLMLISLSFMIALPRVHAQWTKINGLEGQFIVSIVVQGDTMFAGGHRRALFRSTDSGTNWTNVNSMQAETTLALTFDSVYVLAGTGGRGLFRSSSIGDSWESISELPFQMSYINGFVSMRGTLLASTRLGVYRSTNHGFSWTISSTGLGSPPTYLNVHRMAGDSSRVFVLADLKQGVHISHDVGATWNFGGLRGTWGNDLVALDTNVFVGSSSGVHLYGGSDTTWLLRNNGLPANPWVYSLRVVSKNLFAGLSVGVYRSTDLGLSWTQVNDGTLFGKPIGVIAANNTNVIAATDASAWRRPVAQVVSVVNESDGPGRIVSFVLDQNYPNPFNPGTSIHFSVPRAMRLTLKVYDVQGRQVAMLLAGVFSSGSYTTEWQPNVSSGLYFCRIEAFVIDDPSQNFVQTRKMLFLK